MKSSVTDSSAGAGSILLDCVSEDILAEFQAKLQMFTDAHLGLTRQLAIGNAPEDIGTKRRRLKDRAMKTEPD
jgi:hypothetical protein